MVVLDDAASQRQAQAPAALFSGETGHEYAFELVFGDALAGVGDVDGDLAGRGPAPIPAAARTHPPQVQRDGAAARHGIHRVFADVLDYPVEQRHVDAGRRVQGQVGFNLKNDLFRYPALQVLDGIAGGVEQVFILQHRHRANIGEPLRDDFEPPDVLAQLLNNGLVAEPVGVAQVVLPAHQAAQRRAQLVSRFLGQAHPHAVLLGPARRTEREIRNDAQAANYHYLHQRVGAQLPQQLRIAVENVVHLPGPQLHHNGRVLLLHEHKLAAEQRHRIGGREVGRHGNVFGSDNVLAVAAENDRNGGIRINYLTEYKQRVRVRLGIDNEFLCLGIKPNLLLLAGRYALHQPVGVDNSGRANEQRQHRHQDFNAGLLVVNRNHSGLFMHHRKTSC